MQGTSGCVLKLGGIKQQNLRRPPHNDSSMSAIPIAHNELPESAILMAIGVVSLIAMSVSLVHSITNRKSEHLESSLAWVDQFRKELVPLLLKDIPTGQQTVVS